MTSKSSALRKHLSVILALGMFACPLTVGSTVLAQPALAATPFQTVRPQIATFTPAVGATGPIPTPIPTLGRGRLFDEGDPGIPDIDEDAMEGDRQFGFMRLPENPELYLIWMTDGDGTHYMVVGADSEVLTGGADPESGFLYLNRERERVHNEIQTTVQDRDSHRDAAGFLRWGAIGALVVGGICVVVTGGTCLVFVGVAGGAVVASIGQDTNTELGQNHLESLQNQLSEYEGDLRHGFRIGQALEPSG